MAGTYALSNGVFGGWNTVLYLNLAPLGVSQYTAGWVGFISGLAGLAASIIVGM